MIFFQAIKTKYKQRYANLNEVLGNFGNPQISPSPPCASSHWAFFVQQETWRAWKSMPILIICMNAFFCIGFSKKMNPQFEGQLRYKLCKNRKLKLITFAAFLLKLSSKTDQKKCLIDINLCQHVQIFKLIFTALSCFIFMPVVATFKQWDQCNGFVGCSFEGEVSYDVNATKFGCS